MVTDPLRRRFSIHESKSLGGLAIWYLFPGHQDIILFRTYREVDKYMLPAKSPHIYLQVINYENTRLSVLRYVYPSLIFMDIKQPCRLNPCGQMTPYGVIDLAQYKLRQRLVTWWHHYITGTNQEWDSAYPRLEAGNIHYLSLGT